MTAAPEQVVGAAQVVDVEYRSPEWYESRRGGIAASEIAAVLGLSPWVSPFDLWWAKKTGIDSQPENKAMRRGRRYEALVLEDFAEEHPELHVGESLTLRSAVRPWQYATPDGIAYESLDVMTHEPDGRPVHYVGEPLAAIEAKTGQRWQWGEPGTDDVPTHYRCQVLWQMDVLGVDVAYLPVLFGDQFAEYVVERDDADLKLMRDAATEFLASLERDEPPPIDSSQATLRRLKRMHPTVEPGSVEVPGSVVSQYRAAKRLKEAAEERMRLAESRIRSLLGPHDVATVNGLKVASRSVYDVKARTQEVAAYTVNRLNFTREKK
jgi:putative phage-type endonuclease